MFYLTTHSTHFIYGCMALDIRLRTILIVRKETRCHHIGYSFRLAARVLLYAPSHRQDNTTTAFVTPFVEYWLDRELAQWVHPMKDRSDNPSHHERTLYLWATSRSSSTRGAMGHWIHATSWTHWDVSRSSQCSTYVLWYLLFYLWVLVPASAQWQRLWYVLSCLWDGAYKIPLAANWKE